MCKERGTFHSETDTQLKENYKKDLAKVEDSIKEFKLKIEKADVIITKGKDAILTYENFLELMDNMAQTLAQIDNMGKLDSFIKKLYLNFYVDKKNVVNSTLNEPFRTLYETKVSNGGR